MQYNVTFRRVRVTIVAVEKAVNITHSEWGFVAIGTHRAVRMRRIILSSAASQALLYFPTLSYKRHGFRKQIIEHKMCVLIFSRTFV
jgi:hypothetical protein